jgi:putative transposase
MDLLADELFNGRRIRALTTVDNRSRGCPAFAVDQRPRGEDVVSVLEQLRACGRSPSRIQLDNGSEYISRAPDKWAYDYRVTLDFSVPGRPTDNLYFESFNGRLRHEYLDVNWFLSVDDPREKIERWRFEYNQECPNSALGGRTPDEFRVELQADGF